MPRASQTSECDATDPICDISAQFLLRCMALITLNLLSLYGFGLVAETCIAVA
jgi:hypothetical protein